MFPPDTGPFDIWSGHPTLHQREESAKQVYLRSPPDDRPAWLLFREAEVLRERVTAELYRGVFGVVGELKLRPPEEVEEHICKERRATTYDPRYHGLFDSRFIEPGDVDVAAREAAEQPWPPTRVNQVLDKVYAGGARALAESHLRHRDEWEMLHSVVELGFPVAGKDVEFRGRRYRVRDLKPLYDQVGLEMEQDLAILHTLDRDIFRAHHQIARALNADAAQDLLDRYRLHQAAQDTFAELQGMRRWFFSLTQQMSEERHLDREDCRQIVQVLEEGWRAGAAVLEKADRVPLLRLGQVREGGTLGGFLRTRPFPAPPTPGDVLPGPEWFEAVGRFVDEGEDRARDVVVKNQGEILALQERIALLWRDRGRKPDPPQPIEGGRPRAGGEAP